MLETKEEENTSRTEKVRFEKDQPKRKTKLRCLFHEKSKQNSEARASDKAISKFAKERSMNPQIWRRSQGRDFFVLSMVG